MALDQVIASLSPLLSPLMPGLFVPRVRGIAGIPAHVTIEENERDEVTVTQHPVEQGAPIGDHAFKQPEEVIIRAGWNLQDGDLSAESGVYGLFLGLQASFALFDVVTGKRIHRNMLLGSIVNTTDSQSEYALLLTLSCRQVILTSTQTAKVGNANPASPSTNGSTINRGPQTIPNVTGNTTIDNLIQQNLGLP